MSNEDLNNNEEINTSGFDAITETFEKIYPEQKEPLTTFDEVRTATEGSACGCEGEKKLNKKNRITKYSYFRIYF